MGDVTDRIPGLIRRVRRVCDLSQRDLAAIVGVGQSRVARWEKGEVSPPLDVLVRMLGLAGFDLAVVDATGEPAEPMRADALRDNAGRLFPAHLDVSDRLPFDGEPVAGARRRDRRDLYVALGDARPLDHPTRDEVFAARREALERRRQVEAAWRALSRPEARGASYG